MHHIRPAKYQNIEQRKYWQDHPDCCEPAGPLSPFGEDHSFPLPVSATQAQRSLYAEVLEQLDMLRQQLKREIKPAEMSGTLIKLNTSARNLIATLEPQLVNLRQVRSEQR